MTGNHCNYTLLEFCSWLFQKDWEVTEKTFRLAKLLGVEKIVMMSGLPVGCPSNKTPVWITTSWPPETQDILD